MQLSEDLPPSRTIFVIISSDQDFRNEFQVAKGRGFTVVVLHNATSTRWTKTLEMYATGYHWSLVVGETVTETEVLKLPSLVSGSASASKKKMNVNPTTTPTLPAINVPTTASSEEPSTANVSIADPILLPTVWVEGKKAISITH
jgi:hypothetical protein